MFAASVHGTSVNEIYAYECGPLQTMVFFEPDIYIGIDSVEDKLKESLLTFNQSHASGEWLWTETSECNRFRGFMSYSGCKQAEGFKIMKYPTGSNDFILKKLLADNFRWAGTNMYIKGRKYFFGGF